MSWREFCCRSQSGPHVGVGSTAPVWRCPPHVRFTKNSKRCLESTARRSKSRCKKQKPPRAPLATLKAGATSANVEENQTSDNPKWTKGACIVPGHRHVRL